MAKAKWSVDPKSVKYSVDAKGMVSFSCSLLDNGVKTVTPTLTVDANHNVTLQMHGEPGAVLGNFQAWSDF